MEDERPDLEAMAEQLAEWISSDSNVTEQDVGRAREALRAIGVPDILATLEMTERVLLFGYGFHSIAGFFADGSEEQDYLRRLARRSGPY